MDLHKWTILFEMTLTIFRKLYWKRHSLRNYIASFVSGHASTTISENILQFVPKSL